MEWIAPALGLGIVLSWLCSMITNPPPSVQADPADAAEAEDCAAQDSKPDLRMAA